MPGCEIDLELEGKKTDLVIDEFEKLEGDIMELVVDRSDDSSDGVLDSSDPRFQWTRIFLGISVDAWKTDHHVDRHHLNKIYILELFSPCLQPHWTYIYIYIYIYISVSSRQNINRASLWVPAQVMGVHGNWSPI